MIRGYTDCSKSRMLSSNLTQHQHHSLLRQRLRPCRPVQAEAEHDKEDDEGHHPDVLDNREVTVTDCMVTTAVDRIPERVQNSKQAHPPKLLRVVAVMYFTQFLC